MAYTLCATHTEEILKGIPSQVAPAPAPAAEAFSVVAGTVVAAAGAAAA